MCLTFYSTKHRRLYTLYTLIWNATIWSGPKIGNSIYNIHLYSFVNNIKKYLKQRSGFWCLNVFLKCFSQLSKFFLNFLFNQTIHLFLFLILPSLFLFFYKVYIFLLTATAYVSTLFTVSLLYCSSAFPFVSSITFSNYNSNNSGLWVLIISTPVLKSNILLITPSEANVLSIT